MYEDQRHQSGYDNRYDQPSGGDHMSGGPPPRNDYGPPADRGYDRGPPPRDHGAPPPPRGDYGPPPGPGYGPPPRGPPAPKGIGATFGLMIMIFAIVGLVLFYALPWVTLTYKLPDFEGDGDEKEYTGSWDQDLEWKDGDKEIKEFMGDDLYGGTGDYYDSIKDTVGLSFLGLVFAMILGIIAMIIGFIPMIHIRWPKIGNALDATFGALILIPALLILFSGMRFLGADITEMHMNAVTEELGYDISSSSYYLGAYSMIVFGFLFLIFALILMIKGLNRIRFGQTGRVSRPAAPPRSGSMPPPMHQPPPTQAPPGPPPRQGPGYGYSGGGY